jgi:hypothetical protein
MEPESTRRDVLRRGTLATAGLLGAVAATDARAAEQPSRPHQDHEPQEDGRDYPRDHAGPGGPVGSATDPGKLVPGLRKAGEPPVPVETPDLPMLPWKMKDGVKSSTSSRGTRAGSSCRGSSSTSGVSTTPSQARPSRRSRATRSASSSITSCPSPPPSTGTAWNYPTDSTASTA